MLRLSAAFCLLATVILQDTFLVKALPTSLLEDAQAADHRIENNKVKRAHSMEQPPQNPDSQFYGTLSAAKRTPSSDSEPEIQEWASRQEDGPDDSPFDDKTLSEYQKGLHYATNKAALDEQMENAILKSEIYGEPAAINQYRYYGDDKRRKRSMKKKRFAPRFKREVELSPEDILTLLSIWEEDRMRERPQYRPSVWSRYEQELENDDDDGNQIDDDDDDGWVEGPVFPGRHLQFGGRPYEYEPQEEVYKKRQWNPELDDKKRKRFMVTKKKRNDPTRELRYLTGPQRDEMLALSQYLAGPRDSYYKRMVF